MVTLREAAMRMPKEYVSVSTRLPKTDALFLENACKRENKTSSEYIREVVLKNLNSQKKTFLSGKNRIVYDKTTNSFHWLVELDSGDEVKVLSNLSENFVKDLKFEIDESLKEKNAWIHNTKRDSSVEIPIELVGGKDET